MKVECPNPNTKIKVSSYSIIPECAVVHNFNQDEKTTIKTSRKEGNNDQDGVRLG